MENFGKFDPKIDKFILLEYSISYKGYQIYSIRAQTMEEIMYIMFEILMNFIFKERMVMKKVRKTNGSK